MVLLCGSLSLTCSRPWHRPRTLTAGATPKRKSEDRASWAQKSVKGNLRPGDRREAFYLGPMFYLKNPGPEVAREKKKPLTPLPTPSSPPCFSQGEEKWVSCVVHCYCLDDWEAPKTTPFAIFLFSPPFSPLFSYSSHTPLPPPHRFPFLLLFSPLLHSDWRVNLELRREFSISELYSQSNERFLK